MTSYKLVTGEMPERYTPKNFGHSNLAELLATYWNKLVTTQAPSEAEWECVDAIRDMTPAHMYVLAEDNGFDREKIRFVPFTEGSRLKFRAGTDSEYIRIMFDQGEKSEKDTCNHYLVFRKRKIVDEERMQKMEEDIENKYW
ncbi:MAG: hypothetical protein PHO02_03705 [Candidatus Nanoarchaeia archaeon]|nr:hypothetical protein [Candidatus Nanoarchaeia archaeon]